MTTIIIPKRSLTLVSFIVFVITLSSTIVTSNASSRRSANTFLATSTGRNRRRRGATWGTVTNGVRSSPGWSIDQDSAVPSSSSSQTASANKYHVIGASRSGFYLCDDNENRSKDETVSKLVRCTRYGERIKKSKGKQGHEDIGH